MAGYDSQARPGLLSTQLEKKATAKVFFFCVLSPGNLFPVDRCTEPLDFSCITERSPQVYLKFMTSLQ